MSFAASVLRASRRRMATSSTSSSSAFPFPSSPSALSTATHPSATINKENEGIPRTSKAQFWSTPTLDAPAEKNSQKIRFCTQDLVRKIAEDHEISQAKSRKILDTMFETVVEKLEKGQDVSIVNFGVFKTVRTAKRMGRNPQTGNDIVIPEQDRVRFSPSKIVKDKFRKESVSMD